MTITYVTGVAVEGLQKRIVQRIVDEKNLRPVLDEIKKALEQVPDPELPRIDQLDGPDRRNTTAEVREERIRELAIWDLYWLNIDFREEVNARLPA
jgi:hypothetical protein